MVKTLDLSRNLYKQKRKRLWLYINLQKKGGRGLIPRSDAYELRYVTILKTICQKKKNSAGLKTETYISTITKKYM